MIWLYRQLPYLGVVYYFFWNMKKLLLLALALFSFGFVFSQEIPLSTIDTTTLQSPFFLVITETEKIKYELKKCVWFQKLNWKLSWTPEELTNVVIWQSNHIYTSWSYLYSSTVSDDYKCWYEIINIEIIQQVIQEQVAVKKTVVSSIPKDVETVVEEQQEETLFWNETDPRIAMFNTVRTKYIKENWSKKAMEMAKKFVTAYLVMQGKLLSNEEIWKVIYKVFTDYIASN